MNKVKTKAELLAELEQAQKRITKLETATNRGNEERWQFALEGTGNGVWDLDLQTNRVFYSRQWKSMLGYAEDEIGDALEEWTTRIHPADLPAVRAKALQHLRKKADSFRSEYRIRCQDGSYRWVLSSGKVVEWTADKKPVRAIGIQQDISERKAAEEKMHESELRFRNFMEQSTDGLMLIDEQGVIIEWNQAQAGITGIPREQALGANAWEIQFELTVPEKRTSVAHLESVIRKMLRTGESRLFGRVNESAILTAQGERKFTQQTAFPIHTTHGDRLGVIFRDVTEYSLLQNKLRESEAVHRRAMEVAGAVPYYESYADHGARITYDFIGEGIRQITGYGPDEFSSELWDSLVEETHLIEELDGFSLDEGIQKIRAGEVTTWKCEYRIRARDGSIHWVLEAAVELWDANGALSGSIGTYQDITARKLAEEIIRSGREKYKGIFDGSVAAIYVFDQDKHFIDSNQAGLELLGYSREELMHMSIPEVDADPVVMLPAQEKLLSGKRLVNYAHKLRRKDQSIITVLNNSIPLTDSMGNVSGMLSTLLDITEREQVEEALRASEERYRLLVEQSPDAIIIDRRGKIVYINPAGVELAGANRAEELIGKTTLSLVRTDYRKEVLQSIRETLKKGAQIPPTAATILRLDGSLLEVEITSSRTAFQGKPARQIISRDITERKQADDKLRESEQKYRDLINGMNDTVWVIDFDTKIVDVNNAASKMLGYTHEELLTMQITDIDAELNPEQIQVLVRSMPQEKVQVFETWHKTKDGRKLPVEISSSLVSYQGRTVIMSIARDITARKKTEEALRASEEKFSKAFLTSPDSVIISDLENGRYLDVNESFLRDTGYERSEIIGFTSLERNIWASPEDRAHLVAGLQQDGFVRNLEAQYKRKSGEVKDALVSAEIIELGGEKKHLLAVVRDITERKRAENALRESEEKMSSIFRVSPTGIGVVIDRVLMDVNPRICEMTGYTKEELLGQNARILYPSQEEFDFVGSEKYRQIAQKGSGTVETCWQKKDGNQIDIILASTPIDPKNLSKGVTFTALDITERKQAEKALQESEERYRALIENAPDGVVLIDTNGKFLFTSPSVERIFGYTQEDLPLCEASLLTHPEDLPRVLAELMKLFENPAHMPTLQYRFRHKNGEWRWIESTFSNLLALPSVEAIIINFRDIHERKLAEDALNKSQSLLTEAQRIGRIGHMEWSSSDQELVCSNEVYNILGLPPGTILTQDTIASMMAPSERDKVQQVNLQALQHRSDLDYEYRITTRAGSERWLHQLGKITYGENGAPTRMIAIIQDVTERRQAEEKLHAEQVRLAKTADTVPGAICTFQLRPDGTLCIPYASKAFEDLYGITLDQVKDNLEAITVKVPAAQAIRLMESVNESAQTMQPWRNEYEYHHPQKGKIWIEGFSMPVKEADGSLLWHGFSTDITERKREERYIEARLRLANLSYEQLDMEILLRTMLDETEALTDSQIGFFHFVDDDQNTISLQTWSTNTIKTMCTAEGKGQHYPVAQAGVWADGIRSGEARIYNDYAGLPNRHELPAGHAPVTRLISLPIKRGNLIVAAIGVGNKPQDYDEHDLEIVQRLANEAFDIILRKRAETALRDSEEKYRGLLESIDSVVATVDAKGAFLYINDTAAEQLGSTASKLIGKNMSDLFPKVIAAQQMANVKTVMETNQGKVFEAITFAQGQPRWYRTSIQPLHDDAGQVTSVMVNSTDIHELKATQHELEELNRTLEVRVKERSAQVQDLYEHAPVGYHSIDLNRRFIAINQTELNMLGYRREELLGQLNTVVFASESEQTLVDSFQHLLVNGKTVDLEVMAKRKDGTTFPVMINAVASYDKNGQFVSSRSTMADVTERKRAEDALRHANLELARAMRMKDEFLANMSHELRTPLNGILGLSEALQLHTYGPLSEKQLRALKNIESSGHHLLSLINDILDLSKIEAGKLEVHIEPISILDVCQASLSFIREPAVKKGIAVEFLPDPLVTTILADLRRLKQIIVNLLSNAVKFTPAGGKVTLKVQANLQQRLVDLSVIDTGIGISAEDLSRLFNPFTQVDSSLTRKHEGTGLGLALVKELAEMHGGSVRVNSTVGQGSTFIVSIPWQPDSIALETLRAFENTGAVQPAPTEATQKHLGKILLAEDIELNMMAIGDFLESQGYDLIYALNGREALEKARELTPDLILMDVQMPEMDGLEATRQLRTDPRFASIPIIMLTAMAMAGDQERCLAAGATSYLSKPLVLKELLELIQKLLGGKTIK